MEIYLKKIIEKYIGNKAAEFSHWAFGGEYESVIGMNQFANLWNMRHEDLFRVDFSRTISEDLTRMIEHWKELKEN